MPTVFVIPVRSFRLGKQRLAASLDEAERARLGEDLADHVATTVATAGELPLIVTADPDVARWAALAGFPSVPEPGAGLDAAAGTGVEWAGQSSSDWVVIHADLPLLGAADVLSLIEVLSAGRQPISPSTNGGTSAIGGRGGFAFSFGVASFHRHLARLDRPEVVVRVGLALDVDSPDDLAAARRVGDGWPRESA
ncbi:MAG TPA: 2-phospho-L-lactate guanylyltransferase [Acidimicrobiia bacterium]|nr:2-phospho-L-lactate guanylyltransferase [Acidimicrobiia bacterium]